MLLTSCCGLAGTADKMPARVRVLDNAGDLEGSLKRAFSGKRQLGEVFLASFLSYRLVQKSFRNLGAALLYRAIASPIIIRQANSSANVLCSGKKQSVEEPLSTNSARNIESPTFRCVVRAHALPHGTEPNIRDIKISLRASPDSSSPFCASRATVTARATTRLSSTMNQDNRVTSTRTNSRLAHAREKVTS